MQTEQHDPFKLFESWLEEEGYKIEDGFIKPDLPFTLSTCDPKTLIPSSRVLYLKKYSKETFIFFTNKNSRKGREMAANPNVSLNFFFEKSFRQIRIEGTVKEGPAKEAEEYFDSRAAESRASAMLSRQSEILENPAAFMKDVTLLAQNIKKLKRPEAWVSYHIAGKHFEFWEGAPFRNHLRSVYKKDLKSKNLWNQMNLYP